MEACETKSSFVKGEFSSGLPLNKEEVLKVKRWQYLLESKRFGEEHEGKYDSHGLPPGGH